MKYAIGIVLVVIGVLGAAVAFSSKDSNSNTPPNAQENKTLILSDVHGLEVDIKDSERLYLPNHQGLYVQGSDKKITSIGEIDSDLMGFSISNTDASSFYASGHPKTGGNLGLIRSNDAGQTWTEVSDGLNGPVDFHSMAVDKKNDNFIYGAYQGTLQRSLDGGNSWEYLDAAPEEQIIQLTTGAQEGQLYAATTKGLYVSNDKGASWSLFGFEDETIIALEVNPTSGHLIANTNLSGLVVSDDNGKTWESSNFGTSDTVLFIASSPSEPTKSYLITRSLKIYQSNDSGASWTLR